MVRSMTGYGRAREILDGKEITVEIKSVNHRFFEFSARVPRSCGYLEEKLKTYIRGFVTRGKTDVNVSIVTLEGPRADVEISHALVEAYLSSLRALSEPYGLPDDLTLGAIARLPDIFVVRKSEEDENKVWEMVRAVAEQAVRGFLGMREAEGGKLREDLLEHVRQVEEGVDMVTARAPQIVEAYRERLHARMREVLSAAGIDEQRILSEAALFADRVDTSEETVRLKSHIRQFREILALPEPVGRKLDFLVQEFNREANTIGSKSQDADTARLVVSIKSEIEKIREQIQNVE